MKTLCVISGGPGKEREVSLSSGKNVFDTLTEAGIDCKNIIIDKDSFWYVEGIKMSEQEGVTYLKENNTLVFQVVHGTYGEDGTLAALLEENNVAYIGSSKEVMRLTINKFETEQLLAKHAIVVPKSFVVTSMEEVSVLSVSFPAFVKPRDEGSSVSLFKVYSEEELKNALEKSLQEHTHVLVQEYIQGREFTCGVVDIENRVTSLLPTEIILTQGDMFDYSAKYTVGGCEEITPAHVDGETIKKIQTLASKVHEVCGCEDISRTDMIMKEDGTLVVLEINTIPGMTKTSFVPAELLASGFTLAQFVEGMLKKYQ
jgi:D-alanine-D-alanine ligase